jgi:hypothetical protein
METSMTFTEELPIIVDRLAEADGAEALDYLRWLATDEAESLSAEEVACVRSAEEEIARGAFVTLEALKRIWPL